MYELREPEKKYLKKLFDRCVQFEIEHGADALYDQIHDIFGEHSSSDLMSMYKELRHLERKGELDFVNHNGFTKEKIEGE